MHWNRTNCWNCSGKLIATNTKQLQLARVLTCCGIVGKKWELTVKQRLNLYWIKMLITLTLHMLTDIIGRGKKTYFISLKDSRATFA